MWLAEELEHLHNEYVKQLETKKSIIHTTPNDPVQILIWDFKETPALIARFKGSGPNLSVPEKNLFMGTYAFEISPGKIVHVPKWKALEIPADNFKGFQNELPNTDNMYMLKYEGMTGTEVLMKIFKK